MSPGVDTDDSVSQVRVRAASALEPLLRIDGRKYDLLFSLLLTAFVVAVLVLTVTSGWGSDTRTMPLVVGVPTLAMLLGLLAVQFSSRVAAMTDNLTSGDLLGMEERVQEMQSRTAESTDTVAEPADEFDSRMGVFAMSFWVLLLFGLVLTIGFTVGIPAYLVAYYRLRADQSWLRTIGYTALIWAFIVVIFIYVLNSPLYPGVLGVEVPFLG